MKGVVHGLSQRRREVVATARVVVDVRRPEKTNLVPQAVEPIVTKVSADDEQRPLPPIPFDLEDRPARHRAQKEKVHRLHAQVDDDVADAHSETGSRIFRLVTAHPASHGEHPLR